MATPESKSFMKYFLFVFVFMVSFTLIKTKSIELFGLALFFTINIIFCLLIGKDLIDGAISPEGKDMEWKLRYGVIIISMVFSLVSSIMMILTLSNLHSKFRDANATLNWSPDERSKLEDAETIFITVTTFIGVTALYVYYETAEDVRKFVYSVFDSILNGTSSDGLFFTIFGKSFGDWVRVLFPVVIIGVGSALYGRLQMPPLEVNKSPKQVICDPSNDAAIQPFKDSFIKSYWFLFAFLIVVLARPFMEANFNLMGLSPSMPLGFDRYDRTLIFGQNPTISLISLLTLGLSNITGWNDSMRRKLKSFPPNKSAGVITSIITVLVLVVLAFLLMHFNIAIYVLIIVIVLAFILFIASFFLSKSNPLVSDNGSMSMVIRQILLMPVLRWDVMYLLAKYAFGLTGLVYAGFSIRDFRNIPADNSCFFKDAHIRQLYIAFIVFLVVYYAFNTFSASTLTSIITIVMRFMVPPTLLGLSSYLIFITNYFLKMTPNLVIQ